MEKFNQLAKKNYLKFFSIGESSYKISWEKKQKKNRLGTERINYGLKITIKSDYICFTDDPQYKYNSQLLCLEHTSNTFVLFLFLLSHLNILGRYST